MGIYAVVCQRAWNEIVYQNFAVFFDNWWGEMAVHLPISQSLCAQLEELKDSRKRERKHQQIARGSKDEIYFIILPWTDLRYYEFITTLKLFYLTFKHLKYQWHICMSASGKNNNTFKQEKQSFLLPLPCVGRDAENQVGMWSEMVVLI